MREPAVHLPLVEALRPAETLEAARAPVDARELRDRIDELPREPLPRLEVRVERRRPAAGGHARPAVHVLHEEEAGAEDRRVVAACEHARVRHVRVAERGEDAVLTQHALVPALRDPERRAPQRQPDLTATDLEELVRGAAGDEAARDRLAAAGESALGHPSREPPGIDQRRAPAHKFPPSPPRGPEQPPPAP